MSIGNQKSFFENIDQILTSHQNFRIIKEKGSIQITNDPTSDYDVFRFVFIIKDKKYIFQCLFTPRTIAVVGASNKDGKMGSLFVRNLLTNYSGEIFPVHPTAKEIYGIQAYPDVTAIPVKIDLLIPLIPASQVVTLIERCVKWQIEVLLAIPSGFGEKIFYGVLVLIILFILPKGLISLPETIRAWLSKRRST